MAFALAAAGAWWLAAPRAGSDAAWRRIHERGVIVIATDASYPPFSAVDENGALFGFDVDLGDEIARRLGVRAEYDNLTYDALLGALIADRDDMVISAYVPRPEYAKEVSFSSPYFVAGTVAVARAGGGTFNDAAHAAQWAAGQTLAVEYGAGGDALARQWARRTVGIRVVPQATAEEALQSAADGRASAALVDAVSAFDFLRLNPTLELAGPPIEPEPYAVVVKAGSRLLFEAINRLLGQMEADGTLPALRARWFGEAAR